MVGISRNLEPPPSAVTFLVDDDDRRSTSTVASTVGTGVISLASRMAALALDFSDKLQDEGGDVDGSMQGDDEQGALSGTSRRGTLRRAIAERRSEEEEEEEEDHDGARSERTVNTAVTGEGEGDVAGEPDEGAWSHHREADTRMSRRRSSLLGGMESPEHTLTYRLPFQICSRLFVAKGNIQLKRMSISQVEDLRQQGYVVVDNFIPRELAQQVKTAAFLHYNRGRMVEVPRGPPEHSLGRPGSATSPGAGTGSGDLVMPLVMGKPPADSTPLALLLVALQELYEDLHEFTRLHRAMGEYQLSLQLPGSSGVPRHRDALPDGGRKRGQRRLTCMVCCGGAAGGGEAPAAGAAAAGPGSGGGAVCIWPPRRMAPLGGSSLRRSPTGSDAGTSFTESDTCSLRSHYTGMGWGYPAPSVTSSMWAEAASALDLRGDDNASLDNASVNESVEGFAMAVASHAVAVVGAAFAAAAATALPGSAAALAAEGGGPGPPPPLRGSGGEARGVEWVEQDGEMVLEVQPLPGRLIMFLSGAVDHSHQPVGPGGEVVSVTAWYQ